MATPRQLQQFAFAAGIDESQQGEVLDAASGFRVLENVRQTLRGAATKRKGFTDLTRDRFQGSTSPSPRTAGGRLFSLRDTIVNIDGEQVDSYSPDAAGNVLFGRVPEPGYRLHDIPSPSVLPYVADTAVCGGVIAVLYDVAGTVYATVLDAETKSVIRPPEVLAATSFSLAQAGVAGAGDDRFIYAFVKDLSTTALTLYYLDTLSGLSTGWSSVGTIAASTSGSPSIATLPLGVALAWGISSTTDRVKVAYCDSSGAFTTVSINTASTTPTAVDVDSDNDLLWVAWNEGTSCKALCRDTSLSLASVATAGTIITAATGAFNIRICVSATSGKARMVVQDTNATVRMHTRGVQTTAGAAATDGAQNTIFNTVFISRPMQRGGRYYIAVFANASTYTYLGNQQAVHVVVDWTEDVAYLRPVANIEPGLVAIMYPTGKMEPIGDASFIYVAQAVKSGSTNISAILNGGGIGYGCMLVELDFADSRRFSPVPFGGVTYLSGAMTTLFDGRGVIEAGFVVRPTKPTTAQTGTGLTLSTGRKYVAVYEDMDALGNWHVSGISDPSDNTGAVANKTIQVTTSTLTVSARLSRGTTRVAYYATADNGGSPPYYRLGYTTISTASATTTFNDTTAEATLTASAKLYSPSLPSTPGGALDRRAPCGLMHLTAGNGVMVGAIGQNVYHCGQRVYGEAPWFSPIFQMPIDGDGEITALAYQDGSFFAFTRTSIYAFTCDAPSDNGAAGGFGQPRRLAVDVGCIDSRSVVVTSLGTFFQSPRGIELLTRAQSVEFIGEPVVQTTTAFPVCTAATVDAAQSLVLFELAEAVTASTGIVSGSGRTAVYDLTIRAWVSTDRRSGRPNNPVGAMLTDVPAQSAAMVKYDGSWRYAWVDANGRLYVENDTNLDAQSTWVSMRAVSAWVKYAGIQGRQAVNRALLLAKRNTSADLEVSFAYDYEDTFSDPAIYPATVTDTLSTTLGRVQIAHGLHDESAGQAVSIQLQDAEPSGVVADSLGTGADWIALTFDGTPRDGSADIPDEAA